MSNCRNCARLESERDTSRRYELVYRADVEALKGEIARLQGLLDLATRTRPIFDVTSSPELSERDRPYYIATLDAVYGEKTIVPMGSLAIWRAGRDYGLTVGESANALAAGRDLDQAAATLRRIAHRVQRRAKQFGGG